MPTHDYIIANGTGAAVRADINLALSAIVSLNSSASEPATMYAYQLWADTALGLLKIRNSANSAWITLRQLDGDFSIVAVEDGLQATPSLTFTNDLNTGIFRPGNDSLAIVTGATRAITITSTQAVGIQTQNPSTALHVAGNARVGADDVTDAHLQIGKGATGNRNSYIDIVGDTTYTDYGLRVIRNNTGANATSELKHRGTGALNITTQEAAPIVFNTTNSPQVTIDSSGRLLVGTSTNTLNINNTDKQAIVLIGDDTYGGLAITGYNGTSNPTLRGPRLTLQRSRGTTDGSMTKVASEDLIGQISFRGADGTDFEVAATIEAYADGEFNTSSDATDSPGRLVFSTTADGASSPTERMRIRSDGTIQFGADLIFENVTGTIAGSGGATNWIGVKDSGGNSIFQAMTAGTGSGNLLVGYSSSNGAYKLQVNSQIFATSATIATSDGRYKENVASLGSCVDLVKALRPVSFTWKLQQDITRTDEDGNEVLVREGHNFPDGTQVGFIAQEVQEVLAEKPWLTSVIKENVRPAVADVEGNELAPEEEFLGIAEGNLIAVLTSALQEAIGRIEQLESTVKTLQGE